MIKRISIWILFLLTVQTVKGVHIVGSEITYNYLGNTQYEIFTAVYRNCNECKFNGIGGGSNTSSCNEINDLELWGYDSTKKEYQFLAILSNTRQSIVDKTILCNGEKSTCKLSNTYSYGVEEHLFKANLDIKNYLDLGYREFKVSISIDSRSPAVHQLNTAKNHFNFCYINTKSGQYYSSPKSFGLPFNRIEINNSVIASAACSIDGYDSISYTIDTAYISESTINLYPIGQTALAPVTVLSGNDATANPPKGFTLKESNGQISFTPVLNSEVGAFVIRLSYFKIINDTMRLMGFIRKDFEYEVVNGSNKNPYFLGGNSVWNACEGVKFSEDINLRDDSFMGVSDTVYAKQRNGESPALSIKIDTIGFSPFRHHTFDWTPVQGSARNLPYSFTINANDSKCPKPGYSSHVYQIRVGKNKVINTTKTQLNCDKYRFNTLNHATGDFVRWVVLDSNHVEISGSAVIDTTFTYTFPSKGKWYIKLISVGNGLACSYANIDSVNIANIKQPSINLGADRMACYKTPITINTNANFTYGPPKLDWFFNGLNINKNVLQLDTNFTSNTSIIVRITDDLGCFVMDTLGIKVPVRWNNTVRDSGLCINFSTKLFLGGLINDTFALKNYTFSGTNINNNYFSAFGLPIGIYNATVSVTDTFNCVYNETLKLEIGVPFSITHTSLAPRCANEVDFNLSTSAMPMPSNGIWSYPPNTQLIKKDTFNISKAYPDTFKLNYTVNKNGCTVDTTIGLIILPIPKITLVNNVPDSLCRNAADIEIKTIESSTEIFIDGIKKVIFTASNYGNSAYINISNTHPINGCKNTFEKTVRIDNEINTVLTPIKNPICFEQNEVLLTLSNNKYPHLWSNNGNGNLNRVDSVSYQYLFNESEKDNLTLVKISINLLSQNSCPNKLIEQELKQNAPFMSTISYIKYEHCALGNYQVKVNGKNHLYYDSVKWSFDNIFNIWNGFSINEMYFNNIKDGSHKITAQVFKNGCFGKVDSFIIIDPKPVAKISANPKESYSARLPEISFNIENFNPNFIYEWNSTPTYQHKEGNNPYKFTMPGDTGKHYFYLTTTSDKGCKDTQSYTAYCLPKDWILVPNAFSPNNDGPQENDIFKPIGRVTSDYKFEIFNMWGQIMFETDNIDKGWNGFYNGKKGLQGYYLYKITFIDDIGRPNLVSGTLILLP